jgi:hypothetical protein
MSPVHTGRSADPADIFDTLLDRMVRVAGAGHAGSGRRD